MTGNSHCFVEWKEEFVSQERGNRVVHYFLKDSGGESVLAVVGTERSVRHMFYVVAEEFLQVYGKESSIHAGYKWRSRREVVDWLTSMLSKQQVHGDRSEFPKHESTQPFGSLESPMDGMGGRLARSFKGHHSDIVWSGVAWKCAKQLKHYPSFCRNGTTIAFLVFPDIQIQSFVFVMAKGENHYLAYLEDMYEDKRGQKKVKVRWFHHNQEVKGISPIQNPHPKEVFITPYAQVISAECVDGPATVLTREHYEKCLASFPHALLARIHLCYWQFRGNRVKPFDLTKLRGYFDQPILSCLGPDPFPRPESICHGLTGEEAEQLSPGDKEVVGCVPGLLQIIRGVRNSGRVRQMDEDGCGNLEEWIHALRIAMPYKLGMRHPGRPTIRPAPPPQEQSDLALEVGTPVDAWWSDGWWEGVVTGLDDTGDGTMQIYFPGESLLLNIPKKDLRESKDWMGDHWVDIQGKPDILSAISANIGLDAKLSTSSNIVKDINSSFSMSYVEVPSSTKLNIVEDEKVDLPAFASSDCLPEDMDRATDKKSPSLNDRGTEVDGVDTNDSCNNVDDVQGNDDNDKHNNDGENGDNTQNFDNSGQNYKALELMELAA
ncbi:hypothetical protein FH972_020213 [Carpinus fangiana]|uniref:BAH domain-containing protein n=1 Tax=Carpinus fangiana TaxID=176857 RepID=A0A5N6RT11_9ROSI|nr:hypothetical protein FH972_020213 [Carpinus fangiana]